MNEYLVHCPFCLLIEQDFSNFVRCLWHPQPTAYCNRPLFTTCMPVINPDLKRAITQLSENEKDKLLLKLVAKDDLLIERLEFELIEQGQTVEERRLVIREFIDRTVRLKQDTAGWVMMDMRVISGYITRHLKVTKDKYGEVELGLYMLNRFFEERPDQLRAYNTRTDKCALYIAKRTEQVLKKILKMNPDYHIEFMDDMNTLLERLYTNCPTHYARQLGIPKNL